MAPKLHQSQAAVSSLIPPTSETKAKYGIYLELLEVPGKTAAFWRLIIKCNYSFRGPTPRFIQVVVRLDIKSL